MKNFVRLIFPMIGLALIVNAHAKNCCNKKPSSGLKPVYCDTSAGRMVLSDGSYSKLYCRYNAIMDIQNVHGCCSWAGGVFLVKQGNVICRDGSISPVCSTQNIQLDDLDHMDRSDDSVDLNDSLW